MADNKDIRDYRDRTRINTHESYEVQYWTKRFGVTSEELVDAVRATGSSNVKKVEAYLAAKQPAKPKGTSKKAKE